MLVLNTGNKMTDLIIFFDSLDKFDDADEIKKLFKDYNKWVKDEHYSIISGHWVDSKPHHLKVIGESMTGKRPHDLWQVPITNAEHVEHHTKYPMHQQTMADKIPELHKRFIEESTYWYQIIYLDDEETEENNA